MEQSVRSAVASDAKDIHALLLNYSDQEVLLPRAISEIYSIIPQFFVVSHNNVVIGCGALEVFTAELGEVRSLAVNPQYKGHNLGAALLNEIEDYAKQLGLSKIMALTYVDKFFHKYGYKTVNMTELPEKVWGVCIKCPKFNHCDEIAVLKYLN
ncbi:MAG: amino-acid N-acetyltransferase [Gammaproteobacteria bacterium]|jgi:amino-acid N-acetyltransferase